MSFSFFQSPKKLLQPRDVCSQFEKILKLLAQQTKRWIEFVCVVH